MKVHNNRRYVYSDEQHAFIARLMARQKPQFLAPTSTDSISARNVCSEWVAIFSYKQSTNIKLVEMEMKTDKYRDLLYTGSAPTRVEKNGSNSRKPLFAINFPAPLKKLIVLAVVREKERRGVSVKTMPQTLPCV